VPDLSERVARVWYVRTLAAADSLNGLGRVASSSRRPVYAASGVARRRVASFLRRAAAAVKSGRMKARDFRRVRAFLFGSLDAAAAGGVAFGDAGGGSSPGGGPSIGPGSLTPGGTVGAGVNPSAATNTAASAFVIPAGQEN